MTTEPVVLDRSWKISEKLSELGMDLEDPDFHGHIAELLYVIGKRDFPDYPWERIYNVEKMRQNINTLEELEANATKERYPFSVTPEAVQDFERVQIQTVNQYLPENIEYLEYPDVYYSEYMINFYTLFHSLKPGNINNVVQILRVYPNMLRDNSENLIPSAIESFDIIYFDEEGGSWLANCLLKILWTR